MIIEFESPIRMWGTEQAWGIAGFDHWFFACQLADLDYEGPKKGAAFFTGDMQLTDLAAHWAVGQLYLTDANRGVLAELTRSIAFFEDAKP